MPRKSLHDEPTEADRQDDLDRQYALFRANPEHKIICPWCFAINEAGAEACCLPFQDGVDLIGKKQFESVQRQMKEIRLGSRVSIHCPYCDTRLKKPEDNHPASWQRPMVSPVCCDLLHAAVMAVGQQQEVERLVEQKKRIEDGVAKG